MQEERDKSKIKILTKKTLGLKPSLKKSMNTVIYFKQFKGNTLQIHFVRPVWPYCPNQKRYHKGITGSGELKMSPKDSNVLYLSDTLNIQHEKLWTFFND